MQMVVNMLCQTVHVQQDAEQGKFAQGMSVLSTPNSCLAMPEAQSDSLKKHRHKLVGSGTTGQRLLRVACSLSIFG